VRQSLRESISLYVSIASIHIGSWVYSDCHVNTLTDRQMDIDKADKQWGAFLQPAHISASNIEWLLPDAVLIQFVSPDDEHDVLETCREL